MKNPQDLQTYRPIAYDIFADAVQELQDEFKVAEDSIERESLQQLITIIEKSHVVSK